jgi:hypothetical protein
MNTKFTFLLTAGLFLAIASQAQYYNNNRDYPDRRDQREIREDRHDIYQDRKKIYLDERYGYDAGRRLDKYELRRDRRELFFDQYRHQWVRRYVDPREDRRFCY